MTRAVVFDLYGTLLLAPPPEARAGVLASLGVDAARPAHRWLMAGLTPALLVEEAGIPFDVARDHLLVHEHATVEAMAEALAKLGGRAPSGRAVELTAALRDAFDALDTLAPGADALLAALAARGIAAALISNCDSFAREALRRRGLDGAFRVVALSCAVGQRKPDRRLFAGVFARLGVAAADAVVVGDSWESDVLGAIRAEARAIWLAPNDEVLLRVRTALAERRGTLLRDRWGRTRSFDDRVRVARNLDEASAELMEAPCA